MKKYKVTITFKKSGKLYGSFIADSYQEASGSKRRHEKNGKKVVTVTPIETKE